MSERPSPTPDSDAKTVGGLTLETLSDQALTEALPDLARLRIEVFREYPYLYEGDLAYEARYIETFAASEGAVIVGARAADGALVGAATAAPMVGQMDAWAAPFSARGYALETLFYFGESVLSAPYRGRGVGHGFFDVREAAAKRWGATHTCFCSVVRAEDHPARPDGHRPLNAFWAKRGYEPLEGVLANFEWKEIGQSEETPHDLQFWIRAL